MNAYFASIGRIGAFDLFRIPSFVPRPGRKRLQQTMRYFENIINEIVEARAAGLRDRVMKTIPPICLLCCCARSIRRPNGR